MMTRQTALIAAHRVCSCFHPDGIGGPWMDGSGCPGGWIALARAIGVPGSSQNVPLSPLVG